ncbi:small RNA degrading nuclease 3 isoform X2 [Hevea brasiliensis]|uniref:small RNA degrading nuclease 3 isoform X2 n=1 Tax=Hevea brasiliensis TaxID=3981 RepID=UPI0025F48304|nr:small RNA degrading nuclease 3 isoform X2 [Hevea brasiliensis]
MDDKLAVAIAAAPEKQVLVEIVKLAQKQGRQGTKGSWKEFLNIYDRKFGSSLSDPVKRSHETLVAFLQTFTEQHDLKFLDYVLQLHSNREVLEQIRKEFPDNESPEQRLVRLTVQHPFYLSKYAFPSYDKDWVVTKLPKKSKLMSSHAIVAVDCEMVLCEDGTDALVRVCVVDHNLQVKLDERVNPCKPVADYRTEITGVAAGDLDELSCSLADIQKSMKKLLRKGTILVGHGLYNDLQALKLDHGRVVDTSFIFKRLDGRPPSLDTLCKAVLGYELRKEGAPHNCVDDACAAMKLVLAKIEHGVDNDIPLNQEDVLETETTKLLLHGIPIDVPSKELNGVFPEKFTVEPKPPKKAHGVQYSALAIFKNSQEAHQAFENLNGRLEKDKNGLEQKMITFKLDTGTTASIYVRKMAHDYSLHKGSLKRRAFQGEDLVDPKKVKTADCDNHMKEIERLKQELRDKDLNQCDNHLKEIERLKQDLSAKDFQISAQDKIISKLKKELEEMKRKRKR